MLKKILVLIKINYIVYFFDCILLWMVNVGFGIVFSFCFLFFDYSYG